MRKYRVSRPVMSMRNACVVSLSLSLSLSLSCSLSLSLSQAIFLHGPGSLSVVSIYSTLLDHLLIHPSPSHGLCKHAEDIYLRHYISLWILAANSAQKHLDDAVLFAFIYRRFMSSFFHLFLYSWIVERESKLFLDSFRCKNKMFFYFLISPLNLFFL